MPSYDCDPSARNGSAIAIKVRYAQVRLDARNGPRCQTTVPHPTLRSGRKHHRLRRDAGGGARGPKSNPYRAGGAAEHWDERHRGGGERATSILRREEPWLEPG